MDYDEQKAITDSGLPPHQIAPLYLLRKAIGLGVGAFFLVSLFLNKEFFTYWFVFFVFVEGLLIHAYIKILTSIALSDQKPSAGAAKSGEKSLFAKATSALIPNILFGAILFFAALLWHTTDLKVAVFEFLKSGSAPPTSGSGVTSGKSE